jgi:hypothetical protein
MNNLPTKPEAPDELDKLLSDFFKAQLKKPWPNAPVPPTAQTSEPSELAAARSASQGAPARPAKRADSTARARFTLAASVALVLGAGILLSNSFDSGPRPSTPVQNNMLKDSGADGNKSELLKKIGENKAKGAENTAPPKTKIPIEMNKIGEEE